MNVTYFHLTLMFGSIACGAALLSIANSLAVAVDRLRDIHALVFDVLSQKK